MESKHNMKAKTLIEKLQKFDPEKIIVIRGYEGGYNEVEEVSEVQLQPDVKPWRSYGSHKEDKNGDVLAIKID